MSSLPPLRFQRRFVEKPWGGRALARRPGLSLPPDVAIGETWEIVDREDGSSVVADGPSPGCTLRELMREHGDEILGSAPPGEGGRFPLLVKYIDAARELSVQVHPDDEAAAAIGNGAEGKTEAWYVLDVAPGGALYAGLSPGVTAEDFERHGSTARVVDMLLRWEVSPGDCMLVPGGTVHAIGAGVTILEVQQSSDTTYRVWDWDRVGLDGRPRETHPELASRAARFGAPERPPIRPFWEESGAALSRAPLARSRHFGMNALRLRDEARLSTGGQFQIYAVVEGGGRLSARGHDPRPLAPGDVWLVPASLGYHRIAPDDGELLLVQMLHRA